MKNNLLFPLIRLILLIPPLLILMTSFGYRLNPRFVIKECSSCGALYTRDCSCSKGSVEDKVLIPKPPKNSARCAKCEYPVNGPYCQGCALLREKLKEDLITYLKYFQDTSESSNDSTNVVHAPREPFVVKHDHGVKSSQNPPHIDECFCECGNALDGIYYQQCICNSCGKGAHIGHNCPPKVSIISNPEPCNQTMNNKLPQTLPSFDSRLLYDNASPRPPEEFNSKNSNAEIESFSPSPIPNEDSDSFMEEIDLFPTPDDPMPPSIKDDDNDSEWDNLFLERLLHDDPIPLPDTLDFSNV
nr:hypothetical protein [Tanacetum cinerariifolium]